MKLHFLSKSLSKSLGAATTLLFLASSMAFGSSRACADEVLTISALPQFLVKSINARFPGAKYLYAERETLDGPIEYEVAICHDGKWYEVDLTPTGVITHVDYEGQCTN